MAPGARTVGVALGVTVVSLLWAMSAAHPNHPTKEPTTTTTGATPRPKPADKKLKPFKHFTQDIVRQEVAVHPYEGGGLPLHADNGRPSRLDCAFHANDTCCWSNVAAPGDEFDWVNVWLQRDNAHNATWHRHMVDTFGTAAPPLGGSASVGSPQTFDYMQAMLVSCTIYCQSSSGWLTLSHWHAGGAKLDVCRLEVGSTEFDACETLADSGTSTMQIPPHSVPFHIVLVGSGFDGAPSHKRPAGGGLLMVDDIQYTHAEFC